MLAALNLSDAQREKVLAIQEEHRKKNWAAMGEVRAEQYKLRGLYGAEKLDADKVAEQQKKVDELRRPMLKSRVEAHNQIAALLTPEQRKELRQRAPGWMMDGQRVMKSDAQARIEHEIGRAARRLSAPHGLPYAR